MRVIARKGMAAATIAEIALEAKIAKGTIYLYFRDRDELVEKTFETAIGHLHARVDESMAEARTFDEKLRAYVTAKFSFFQENAEFFRLYRSLRMPEGSPQQQRRQKRTCQPQYRARIEAMAAEVKRAMERGEVRKMDPMRLALFLVEGSTAIVLERLTEDNSPPLQNDIDLVVELLLSGVVPHKSKRSRN